MLSQGLLWVGTTAAVCTWTTASTEDCAALTNASSESGVLVLGLAEMGAIPGLGVHVEDVACTVELRFGEGESNHDNKVSVKPHAAPAADHGRREDHCMSQRTSGPV